MFHSKRSGALSDFSRLFTRQPSIVNRKSALILILSLLPLNSCGRHKAQDALEQNQYFVEMLKREDRRWLGEDGFFENGLLANPHPAVRQWSAVAMGRIGSPRALPLLLNALRKGDAAARAASVFAIGEIENREHLNKAHLAPLPDAIVEVNNLLDDPSITVRMRAVEALGKIGSDLEAGEIARRLESFDFRGKPAERAYMNASITALVRLGDPMACPVLEKLAGESDSAIRCCALDALLRLRSKTSGPLFVKNLKNPNPEVRSCAARGLGITENPNLAVMLLPLLSPRLEESAEPNPIAVRLSALQALGELAAPLAIPSIEAALLADPIDNQHPDQQHFAMQAAATLGRIGNSQGISTLLPLLKLSGPVADNAVIALGRILKGSPERFFQLADREMFNSPAALPAWIQAMAELGGPDACEELHQILAQATVQYLSTEASIPPLILNALAQAEAPDLQTTLVPFLQSHDAALLRAAIAAYKPKPGTKAPWDPIIQAFSASAASGNIQARLDILSYMKPWVRQASVQQLLRSGLEDPERNVRLACAALLRGAGVTDISEKNGSSEGAMTDALCRVLAATRKNNTIAQLETNRGTIEIELFREDAPVTAANFVLMASGGAYNGMEFRQTMRLQLIEGWSCQAQAVRSRTIVGEVNMRPFERGSVGMALSGGYSQTGRFFIALAPQPYRDGIYTCFGRVVSGMQVADRIIPGDQIRKVFIKETINFHDYQRY
jgi:cyclophilin family peptidyl-prolyl cis-trans isomerase/HEAT repeat protein